jgi:hypothetical protein
MTRSLLFAALIAVATPAFAQNASLARPSNVQNDDWRVTLTIFRSPGTGLQLSRGHFAAFAAHYPTVIKRDGKQRDTQFLRFGVAAYAAPDARTSPYASLSFAPSLTKGWSNSGLADVGLRQQFTDRFNGQLGVALLYAPQSRETRVNPTIGLGVRF